MGSIVTALIFGQIKELLDRRLGKATIAEFVGDARTLELLRGYGVDYVQGHHIGRPQPIDQIWPGVGARELIAVRG